MARRARDMDDRQRRKVMSVLDARGEVGVLDEEMGKRVCLHRKDGGERL